MNNFTPQLISRNYSYVINPHPTNKTTLTTNNITSNGGNPSYHNTQSRLITKSSSLANYKLNIPLPHQQLPQNKYSYQLASTLPKVTLTTSSSQSKMRSNNSSLKEINNTFLEKTKSDFNESLHKCYSNISQIQTKIKMLSGNKTPINNNNNNNTVSNSITASNTINNERGNSLINEENENVRISNSILARTNADLMSKIKEMNNNNNNTSSSDIQNKIDELVKMKEDLQCKLNDVIKENKNLNSINQSFQNKLNLLTNENSILTNKLLEMNMIIQTKQNYTNDIKNNYEERLTQLHKENKEIQNELNENKNEIHSLNSKLHSYETTFSTMKNDIQLKDNTISQLKTNINTNNKELITQNESNLKLIQFQSSKIKQLQNELSLKTKTLHNIKQSIDELLLHQQQQQQSSQYTHSQFKSFLNRIQSLLGNININYNCTKCNNNNNEIEHLKQQIALLTSENQNLQAQITTTTSNYDNELTMRNKQLLLLHDENTILKNECTSHNQKVTSLLKNTSPQLNNNTNTLSHSNTTSSQSLYLFRIYDKSRIICFDLTSHEYQIIEFIDNANFSSNYIKDGSICLNTLTGLFILTNKNCDTLYYYNYNSNSISHITQFKCNHSHGALVLDTINNAMYVISGCYNKKVEKYLNDNMMLCIYDDVGDTCLKDNDNETLTYIEDMQCDRSESGVLFMNGIIYMFYGYSYIKNEYVDSIEYYDTNKDKSGWKVMGCSSIGRKFLLKENAVVPINEDEVFLLGGYDGVNNTNVENLIVFNFKYKTIREEKKKLPDIVDSKYYGFGKESMFISYIDNENMNCLSKDTFNNNNNNNNINSNDRNKRIIMGNIDDNDNVHLIQIGSLRYDLFKFD